MSMDVEVLSRVQFAMTVSFHFLFPPLTIGLGLMLVDHADAAAADGRPAVPRYGAVLDAGVRADLRDRRGDRHPAPVPVRDELARYARFVGDIFGSPLAIEGIYAFFLESGFLALLLFGWNRIGPRMHLFATCMVSLGAHFSAIWILVANSWMQTPAGYHLARQVKVTVDGREFPMTADLGGQSFAIREVPLPADYVVQPEDLPARPRGGR